jgi:hypothetical protein
VGAQGGVFQKYVNGMNANGIADKFIEESYMLQAVLILQKSKSRSVENATGNGAILSKVSNV